MPALIRSALIGLLMVFVALPALAQSALEERIAELNAAFLDVMQDADALGFDGRYDRLEPVLDRVFGFEEMARSAAGGYWGRFDADGRERYVDAFRRMSIATFASRFDDFSGETIEIVGERPGPRETRMVETGIASPGEAPVSISYLFREVEGDWQVVDVYLEATYSEIAVKRSEYTSLLRQQGLEGLIQALDGRVEAMRRASGG